MNGTNHNLIAPRGLSDILKDLAAAEKRCQWLKNKNDREFDRFAKRMVDMTSSWRGG